MSAASGEPDVSRLPNVQQAIRIIDDTPVAPRIVRVSLDECQGLRLAEDLRADRDYPPFDKSLMDGYAVRLTDVGSTLVELEVIGEVAAGGMAEREIGVGEAMGIMTGAPMPPGADGVVPVEDVERRAEIGEWIRVLQVKSPARYIARKGSDCAEGRVVLKRGMMLGPAQIAVAASVGSAHVDAFARPRIAVLGTGDELSPIDQVPGPSQIRNSNSPMLVALLRRLGCDVSDLGIVRDDPALIREAIAGASNFDALFVTGGMSMGEYDYVPRILAEMEMELKITRLRIKPGKPFVFAVNPEARTLHPGPTPPFVFGLPGNPVSAFICTLRFASRLLSRIAGGGVEERWLSGRLNAGLPANGPREFYQPAVRTVAPGWHSAQNEFASIAPLPWKGSADIYTLAAANVLLVRAENEPPVPKGTVIRVLEI